MTMVLKGCGEKACPRCHEVVGTEHAPGCAEASMQEAAKNRPADYAQLSGGAQWDIDARLGILDWEGY
jgi:hypothetical protein